MAERVEKYSVTVPANTALGAYSEALDFTPGYVTHIEVKIPKGHVGKTGIRVTYSQVAVIPRGASKFLRGNGVSYEIDVDNYPTGTGWIADCGNVGKRNHTFELLFTVVDLEDLAFLAPRVILVPFGGEPGGDAEEDGVLTPIPGAGGGGGIIGRE